MPEMDGLAATRAMRDDPTLHDLPIIAMTANAMKADLDACLAAGMNDHITKPIERKALLQTLRRWLPARQEHLADADPVRPGSSCRFRRPRGARAAVRRSRASTWQGRWHGSASSSRRFRRMLVRFADGQGADARRAACGRGLQATAPRLHRHAHAIAGASGNLGADALHAAAKALERAGRDGRRGTSRSCLPIWKPGPRWCSAPSTRLRGAIAPVATEPGQLSVPATARAALERLQAALGDFDLSAASERTRRSRCASRCRAPPAIWRGSGITSTATSTTRRECSRRGCSSRSVVEVP